MLYDDLFLEEVIDHSYNDSVYKEETNCNPNTYTNVLLEELSEKAKKRLKVGAAIAGTGAALFAAHKTGALGKATDAIRRTDAYKKALDIADILIKKNNRPNVPID